MDFADWVGVGELVGGFGTLIFLIFAYVQLRHSKESSTETAQLQQVSNIPELLSSEYLDRQMRHVVEFNGVPCADVKAARSAIRARAGINQDPEELAAFHQATRTEGTPEALLAMEIGIGLNRIATMVLCGAIPFRLVYSMVSLQVLEDWTLTHDYVEHRLRPKHELSSKKHSVAFLRHHAEWLAYAVAIELDRDWEGKALDWYFAALGPKEDWPIREKTIRSIEQHLMPSGVARDLKAVFGPAKLSRKHRLVRS